MYRKVPSHHALPHARRPLALCHGPTVQQPRDEDVCSSPVWALSSFSDTSVGQMMKPRASSDRRGGHGPGRSSEIWILDCGGVICARVQAFPLLRLHVQGESSRVKVS